MKNRFFIFSLLIAGLNFNAYAMEKNTISSKFYISKPQDEYWNSPYKTIIEAIPHNDSLKVIAPTEIKNDRTLINPDYYVECNGPADGKELDYDAYKALIISLIPGNRIVRRAIAYDEAEKIK